MIPLQFALFWAGAKLSYLRFLTFKSLRHFHPKAKIWLYIAHEFNKGANKWGVESQDFQKQEQIGKDYIEDLPNIGVEVQHIKYIGRPDFCPVLQADMARFLLLKMGLFYLDTDQIILKSFESLPLDKEFIYCRYNEVQCSDYLPTGVLGLEKDSPIADIALREVAARYRQNDYNSSGPWAMRQIITKIDLSRSFNAPFMYFYPINSSSEVKRIYEGRVRLTDESMALHWFGAHSLSQEFNRNYTEEFAKKSNDTISKTLRDNGIL